MVQNLILFVVLLLLSIFFFLKYNSGYGPPMGSWQKRTLYILFLLTFFGSIHFLFTGIYYNQNSNYERIVSELNYEIIEYEKTISNNKDVILEEIEYQYIRLQGVLNELDSEELNTKFTSTIKNQLRSEFHASDVLIETNINSSFLTIENKLQNIIILTQDLDKKINKEYGIYINILVGLIVAIIVYIIAFTFKNKILV